jgi:hypothetical protein
LQSLADLERELNVAGMVATSVPGLREAQDSSFVAAED